jgi:predicted amidophosphoribosyltransferase
LCALVEAVVLYREVDGFVAIPCASSKKFSLPRGFASELARRTGKANFSESVTKAKPTPELKNLSRADKLEAILGSVTVDSAKVAGKSIVVVDDLYQSGLTINYVAEELRLAGAREVFGLAAVKTLSNDDNLAKSTVPPQTGDDGDDEILF